MKLDDQDPNSKKVKSGARFIPIIESLSDGGSAPEIIKIDPLVLLRYAPESFYFQRSSGDDTSYTPKETILAFDPFESLRFRHGYATIANAQGNTVLRGSPFQVLSSRMEYYKTLPDPRFPFFQGGALGYFAYDSIRYLENKLIESPGNLQKISDGFDAEFMFFKKLIIFDHGHQRVLFVSGIDPRTDSIEQGLKQAYLEIEQLRELYLSAAVRSSVSLAPLDDCPEVKIEEMKSLLGKEQYLVGVRKLKEHIGCGDIFQAVLSDRFTATFDGDPGDLFNVLSRLSPSPYQFYFPLNKKTFLGASPEMLLRIHGDTLETHPIAGTRRRGKTSEEDLSLELELMDDMKEKAEHIMLVDLARNDIGRVSKSGTVRVDSFMKTRRFSSVMHLVSRVLGDKKEGISSIEALAACFPAGTLSGAPKIRAMQLISELEPEPRNVYGGAMVAASFTGDLDSCIAIRSLEVGNGQVTLQVGAGIVADSIPEIEYEEVQHKSQMVRKALALANQNKMRIKSTFDSKVGEK